MPTASSIVCKPCAIYKMELRPEVVNKALIQRALRSLHGHRRSRVTELKIGSGGVERGSGHVTDGIAVEVNVTTEDGNSEVLRWFIKVIKQGNNNAVEYRLGDREVGVYAKLIPALKGLGYAPFPRACEYIFSDSLRQTLIIEFLGPDSGWRDAIAKRSGLDLGHVDLVLEWLATFHAMCFVLMRRHPGGPEAFLEENEEWLNRNLKLKKIEREFTDEMLLIGNVVCKALEKEEHQGLSYRDIMTKFYSKTGGFGGIRDNIMKADSPFKTLNHGDLWFNNVLFHYSDLNDASSVDQAAILDFQLLTYSSPAYDLAYFLLISTTKEFRRKHLTSVLGRYHSKLIEVAVTLGEDLSWYTFDNVLADYRLGRPVGLNFSIFGFVYVLCQPDDTGKTFFEADLTTREKKERYFKEEEIRIQKILEKSPNMKQRLTETFAEMSEYINA